MIVVKCKKMTQNAIKSVKERFPFQDKTIGKKLRDEYYMI